MTEKNYPIYHHQAVKQLRFLSRTIMQGKGENIAVLDIKDLPEGKYGLRAMRSPLSTEYLEMVKTRLRDHGFELLPQTHADVLEGRRSSGDHIRIRNSSLGTDLVIIYTVGKRPTASRYQRILNSVSKYPFTIVSAILWTITLSLIAYSQADEWKYDFFATMIPGMALSLFPLLVLLWEDKRYGKKYQGYYPKDFLLYPTTFLPRAIGLYAWLGLALGIPDAIVHGVANAVPYALTMGGFVGPVFAAAVLPALGLITWMAVRLVRR